MCVFHEKNILVSSAHQGEETRICTELIRVYTCTYPACRSVSSQRPRGGVPADVRDVLHVRRAADLHLLLLRRFMQGRNHASDMEIVKRLIHREKMNSVSVVCPRSCPGWSNSKTHIRIYFTGCTYRRCARWSWSSWRSLSSCKRTPLDPSFGGSQASLLEPQACRKEKQQGRPAMTEMYQPHILWLFLVQNEWSFKRVMTDWWNVSKGRVDASTS
jgi:hypothetical protein